MSNPQRIYDNLLMATGSPPKALRMVRAEYPHFIPRLVKILPRPVPVEVPASPALLAADAMQAQRYGMSSDALWKAIHREHPAKMKELHEYGEALRAQGKPGPVVVYP
jgi:hypothetical protein